MSGQGFAALSPERRRAIASLGGLACKWSGDARWRGKLPVPQHVHWAVRRLFELFNEHRTTIKECTDRAGLGRTTIGKWAHCRQAKVADLEAALNAMGYELRIVKRRDVAEQVEAA